MSNKYTSGSDDYGSAKRTDGDNIIDYLDVNQDQLDNNTADISQLQSQMTTAQDDIQALQIDTGALEERMDAVESVNSTQTTNIATNTSAISSLTTTVSGHTTSINTLNTEMDVVESVNATQTTNIATNASNISSLSSTVSSHTSTLATHTTEIASLDTRVDTLEAIDLWDRNTTTLVPATSGDSLLLGNTGTTADTYLHVKSSTSATLLPMIKVQNASKYLTVGMNSSDIPLLNTDQDKIRFSYSSGSTIFPDDIQDINSDITDLQSNFNYTVIKTVQLSNKAHNAVITITYDLGLQSDWTISSCGLTEMSCIHIRYNITSASGFQACRKTHSFTVSSTAFDNTLLENDNSGGNAPIVSNLIYSGTINNIFYQTIENQEVNNPNTVDWVITAKMVVGPGITASNCTITIA